MTVLAVLAKTIRQESEMIHRRIGRKELRLSLLEDNTIIKKKFNPCFRPRLIILHDTTKKQTNYIK